MRPQFTECVAYLCGPSPDGRLEPRATAFFVAVERHGYLVTAAHVVSEGYAVSDLHVRVNLAPDGVKEYLLDRGGWFLHDSADVAIGRFPLPWPFMKYAAVPTRIFADSEEVETENISVGDTIFASGLFSLTPGKEEMLPVVRFGRISRMPREPLLLRPDRTSAPRPMPAYLCELAAWGGSSGSPVFVDYGWRPKDVRAHAFLGLIHGHFELAAQPAREKAPEAAAQDLALVSLVGLNSGLAAVIRAEEISELLFRDDVVAERAGKPVTQP